MRVISCKQRKSGQRFVRIMEGNGLLTPDGACVSGLSSAYPTSPFAAQLEEPEEAFLSRPLTWVREAFWEVSRKEGRARSCWLLTAVFGETAAAAGCWRLARRERERAAEGKAEGEGLLPASMRLLAERREAMVNSRSEGFEEVDSIQL